MVAAYHIPDLPQIPLKQCTKCKEWLPATREYFYSHVRTKDGLNNECRPCALARRHKYVANNTEQINARSRESYRANPEPIRVKRREYVANNHERVKAQKREHHAANSERLNAKSRAHYAANPEPAKIYQRKHRAINPEAVRANRRKRRAREAAVAINDFTAAQWIAMQIAYDHRCSYCNKRCKGKLSQDHVTPLSKGGNHTLSNIVPACKSCNSRKHAGPVLSPVQPLLLL